VPIEYHRNSEIEWDRSEGIGGVSWAALGIGAFFLFIASVSHGGWPLVIGATSLTFGILGAIQGLFDVVVYVVDPETGHFTVRRIVWRKVDEELNLPLKDIERFELEHYKDEHPNVDGDPTRIVALMVSGDRIPLVKEFAGWNLSKKAEMFNQKLRQSRQVG